MVYLPLSIHFSTFIHFKSIWKKIIKQLWIQNFLYILLFLYEKLVWMLGSTTSTMKYLGLCAKTRGGCLILKALFTDLHTVELRVNLLGLEDCSLVMLGGGEI